MDQVGVFIRDGGRFVDDAVRADGRGDGAETCRPAILAADGRLVILLAQEGFHAPAQALGGVEVAGPGHQGGRVADEEARVNRVGRKALHRITQVKLKFVGAKHGDDGVTHGGDLGRAGQVPGGYVILREGQ